MNLEKETLMRKDIGSILDLCIKLNADNEDLRKKNAALRQEKASDAVKKTNAALRKKNAELTRKLEVIGKAISVKTDEV